MFSVSNSLVPLTWSRLEVRYIKMSSKPAPVLYMWLAVDQAVPSGGPLTGFGTLAGF